MLQGWAGSGNLPNQPPAADKYHISCHNAVAQHSARLKQHNLSTTSPRLKWSSLVEQFSCLQASIVLGHPAAPVLPKSRFDISETDEDLVFDTPLCRQLKLKVKH